MTRRVNKMVRKMMPLLAAGVLLQTGGCDASGALTGVLTTVASVMINQLTAGMFNLMP